jgi:hypothetical protein
MSDPLHDYPGVVNCAVIGALLDDRNTEGAFAAPSLRVRDQRIGPNELTYGRLVEQVGVKRADQPIGVTIRRQKDRNATAEQQRAVVRRLMIVAIKENEIILSDKIA